jgi:hypothetical protein
MQSQANKRNVQVSCESAVHRPDKSTLTLNTNTHLVDDVNTRVGGPKVRIVKLSRPPHVEWHPGLAAKEMDLIGY